MQGKQLRLSSWDTKTRQTVLKYKDKDKDTGATFNQGDHQSSAHDGETPSSYPGAIPPSHFHYVLNFANQISNQISDESSIDESVSFQGRYEFPSLRGVADFLHIQFYQGCGGKSILPPSIRPTTTSNNDDLDLECNNDDYMPCATCYNNDNYNDNINYDND